MVEASQAETGSLNRTALHAITPLGVMEGRANPIDGQASAGLEILTESLILAQDERWRRA